MKSRIASFAALVLVVGMGAAYPGIHDDLAGFTAGNQLSFSTAGHSKAGPIDVSIKYPIGWEGAEGIGHILRLFSRSYGDLDYGLTIYVSDHMSALDADSPEKYFADEDWAKQILPPQSVLLSNKVTRFAGQPAGIVEYRQELVQSGVRFRLRVLMLNFVSHNRVVQISGAVSTINPYRSDSDLELEFSRAKPLFLAVFNRASLDGVAGEMSDDGRSISGKSTAAIVLVCLLIAGVLGPVPAMAIRFAALRRPAPPLTTAMVGVAICGGYTIVHLIAQWEYGLRAAHGVPIWLVLLCLSMGILCWPDDKKPTTALGSRSTATPAYEEPSIDLQQSPAPAYPAQPAGYPQPSMPGHPQSTAYPPPAVVIPIYVPRPAAPAPPRSTPPPFAPPATKPAAPTPPAPAVVAPEPPARKPQTPPPAPVPGLPAVKLIPPPMPSKNREPPHSS